MKEQSQKSVDQYDKLLRMMEEGLLISVNNSAKHEIPSDELEVKHSDDDSTNVRLEGPNGSMWQIRRDHSDTIVLEEFTSEKAKFETDVITIEILGMTGK